MWIHCDGSHSVNKYGFNLFVLLVKDEAGKGYPVAFMISSTLANAAVQEFVTWCFEATDMQRPPFCMVDDADAEINALVALGIKPVLCNFHFMQALNRSMSKLATGLVHADRVVFKAQITALHLCTTKGAFDILYSELMTWFAADGSRGIFKLYFVKVWSGKRELWSRYGHPTLSVDNLTNNTLERFNKSLKYDFMGQLVNRRISDLVSVIYDRVMPHYANERVASYYLKSRLARTTQSQRRGADLTLRLGTYFYDNTTDVLHVQSSQTAAVVSLAEEVDDLITENNDVAIKTMLDNPISQYRDIVDLLNGTDDEFSLLAHDILNIADQFDGEQESYDRVKTALEALEQASSTVEGVDEDIIARLLSEGHRLGVVCGSVVERFSVVIREGRVTLTGNVWQLNVESMVCGCPKSDGKCVHHIVLYKGDMFSPEVFNRICQRLRDSGFQLPGPHCFCEYKKNHMTNMFPYKLCVHEACKCEIPTGSSFAEVACSTGGSPFLSTFREHNDRRTANLNKFSVAHSLLRVQSTLSMHRHIDAMIRSNPDKCDDKFLSHMGDLHETMTSLCIDNGLGVILPASTVSRQTKIRTLVGEVPKVMGKPMQSANDPLVRITKTAGRKPVDGPVEKRKRK